MGRRHRSRSGRRGALISDVGCRNRTPEWATSAQSCGPLRLPLIETEGLVGDPTSWRVYLD